MKKAALTIGLLLCASLLFGQTATVTVNQTTKVTQPPVGVLTLDGAAGFVITRGTGSPNGSVTAGLGSMYLDQAGAVWFKQTGTGNTGWAQVGTGGTTTVTGTGFWHNTAGVLDPAARAVNLGSSDVTGTLAASSFPAFTGDVTTTAGSTVTHLASIPDLAVAQNRIQWIASGGVTGTPPINNFWLYFDPTDQRLHDKNTAGTIATTVVPSTGGAGQYVNGMGSNGVLSYGTPAGGGGTPSAPANSVQFNNAGAFGGSANFTFNGTTVLGPPGISSSAVGVGVGAANVGMRSGGGYLIFDDGGDAAIASTNNPTGLQVPSTYFYGWPATGIGGANDTALYRNAAGVVEIDNGTAGTYRDLVVRNITINGTCTGAGCGTGGGGGTPSAPANSVQFNNAGAFGGSANFTWNNSTKTETFTNGTGTLTIAPGPVANDWALSFPTTGASSINFGSGVALGYAGGAGYIAGDSSINDIVFRTISNSNKLIFNGSNGGNSSVWVGNASFGIGSTTMTGWSAGNATGTIDTGLYRNASGVLEIDNGTVGTYRDLIGRYFISPPVGVGGGPSTVNYSFSGGTGSGMIGVTDGSVQFQATNQPTMAVYPDSVRLDSPAFLGWAVRSNWYAYPVPDIALARNAAGVLEIDNGVAGTYADLILRNLTVNGTCTGCGGGGGAVTSVFGRTGAVVAAANDYTFAQIGSKPTTLAGYGITDPVVVTSGSYANPAWITSLVWTKITGTPTTLAGYGITNAEPSLGNPSVNGYVLSSTTTGTRSWVANGTGGGGNVSNSGTPTSGQVGIWQTATTIAGVTPTSPITSTATSLALNVGVNFNFTAAQSITLTPPSSNTVAYPLTITNNTSGIPAAGLGTGLIAAAKDSTTAGQEMGELDWVWSTSTHASLTSFADFWLYNAGVLTDVARLFGDGSLSVGNTVDLGTPGINLNTSGFINWGNDVALYRQGAGVLEIDNGTAGQLRDLSIRNLSVVNSATIATPTVTGDPVGIVFVKRLTGVNLTTTANNASNIVYTVPTGRTCILDAIFQVTTAATSTTPTTQAVWQPRCSNGTNLAPATTNNATLSTVGNLIQQTPTSGSLGTCPSGSTVNVNINTATSNATQTADFTALLLIY